MKIKSIECTCEGHPSQWEGVTDKNEAIYIRYRWGRLSIYLSAPDGTIEDAIYDGEILYSEQISSDEYDGFIDLEEVLEIIKREGL